MRQGSLWMRLFPALWMRWAVCIIVGAAAVVALVVFVEHNNNNSEAKGSPKSLVAEQQEAKVLIGADQAPHTFAVKAGQSVQAGFVAAVHADLKNGLKTGDIQGRIQRIACHRAGARGGRVAYHCVAQVQNVKYPFVGVYVAKAKRITYCKRDAPPLPSENIPVSRRCRL
jgi:hypothetical protein